MISPSAGGGNVVVTKNRPENTQNCFRGKKKSTTTLRQWGTRSYSVDQVIDANEGDKGCRTLCRTEFHSKYLSLSLFTGREFILKKAGCITVRISSDRA